VRNDIPSFAKAKFTGLFLGLVLWVTLVFSNSLSNQFMIDDSGFFVNPHAASHVSREIPRQDSAASSMLTPPSLGSRPVSRVLRSSLYQIFGAAVEPYHVFNLILLCLFALSSVSLVFLISRNEWTAFATAALFCVHPINAVVVDYITGHEIILYGLFANLTLIFFCMFKESQRVVYQGISLICLTIALLCHELAVLLPIFQIFLLSHGKGRIFRLSGYWRDFGSHAVVVLLYGVWRLWAVPFPVSLMDAGFPEVSVFFNDVTAWGILMIWYLGKLIFPYGIVLIWGLDPAAIRFPVNLLSWIFFIVLAVIIRMLVKSDGLSRLALTWFGLGFLPLTILCLVYPAMGWVIEPHWFFFSGQGFFLWLILLMHRLSHSWRFCRKSALLIGLMIALSVNTYFYNRLWRDEKTYCQYWLSQSPHNRPVHFWLANAYLKEGLWSEAGEHLRQSLVNRFMDWEVYNNLGLISVKRQDWESALTSFHQALAINPRTGIVFHNLGLVYRHLNQHQLAKRSFQKAVAQDPYLIPPRLNLAELSLAEGRQAQAYHWHKEILAINPREITSQLFLLESYGSRQSSQTESIAGQLYRTLSPENVQLCVDAANILAFYQYPSWARQFYQKAVDFNPEDARVHLELGKFYANQGRLDLAIKIWKRGQSFNPREDAFQSFILRAQSLAGASP
jgi:tetratricopeptide (TPR) repeat protein